MEAAMLHKVFLLSVGLPGNITYRARPAYTPVTPGDTVKFVNRTGLTVNLVFPGGVFAKPSTSIGNAGADVMLVMDVPSERYVYSGTVGDPVAGQPVLGESSPEIIVDRD
jgi:hypothetical protein